MSISKLFAYIGVFNKKSTFYLSNKGGTTTQRRIFLLHCVVCHSIGQNDWFVFFVRWTFTKAENYFLLI